MGCLGSPSPPSGCLSSPEQWAEEFTWERTGGWGRLPRLHVNGTCIQFSLMALSSPPVPQSWALASPIQWCRREGGVLRRETFLRTRWTQTSWGPLLCRWILASPMLLGPRWAGFIPLPSPRSLFTAFSLTVTGGDNKETNTKSHKQTCQSSSWTGGLRRKDVKLGQGTLLRCRPVSYFQTGRKKKNEVKGFWCMILRDASQDCLACLTPRPSPGSSPQRL